MRGKRRSAPAMTERITIQQIDPDAATTGHGEVDRTDDDNWEDVAVRWCQVTPQGAGETVIGDQVIAATTTDFMMRHDAVTSAISPENRIQFASATYNIGPIVNIDNRNEFIKVTGIKIE